MNHSMRTPHWLRLSIALLALCAWLAQPNATSAQSSSPTALIPGQLTKGTNLPATGSDSIRSYSVLTSPGNQVLIGAINLDGASATAPKVRVACPNSVPNTENTIPASGQSLVVNGLPTSAVFCTPSVSTISSSVQIGIEVENTNFSTISVYGVFAITLNTATQINLPDSGDNLKHGNLLALNTAIYRLPEQNGVDVVKFLLQYNGIDAQAQAFVYRDSSALAGCRATRWWNTSGNPLPTTLNSCDLDVQSGTFNNNYLVVMNTLNNCITYRVYLSASMTTTLPLDSTSCRVPS